MAVPLAIAAVAGTAFSAYGQLRAGEAQARVAEQNALIAEENARQAEASTADKLEQLGRRTSITLGIQRAGYGKAGVKRTGTALDVLTDTVLKADRDAYRIEVEGANAIRAALFQAAQERYKAKVAKQQSYIGAGSTLLTGFGQTGLAWGYGKSSILPSTAPQTLGKT